LACFVFNIFIKLRDIGRSYFLNHEGVRSMFHRPKTNTENETIGSEIKPVTSSPVSVVSTPTPTETSSEQTSLNEKDKQPMTNAQDNKMTEDTKSVDIPQTTTASPFQRPAVSTPQPTKTYGTTSSYSPAPYGGTPAMGTSGNGRRLVIGEGITMSGEIESCDHLLVEGSVEAALKGAKVLEISETGKFYGTVEIEEATIAGHFEGEVNVSGRLTLTSTGVITGTIVYGEIQMEAGSRIDGRLSPMGSTPAKKSKGKPAAKKNEAELPLVG
jgi:cytoskeletal protein CcmA (bactofilin family)